MLKRTIIAISIIMAFALILIAGCSNKAEVFGTPINDQITTKIDTIIASPDSFHGKTVKVEGQIVNECPGGHWFYMKGEKELIYTTLSGFVLPQKVGKVVVVEGNVINENDKPAILGKGVEVK
jgi:predicted small secreted protein